MKVTNGKRKQWGSAEKARIVLAGLQADTKISELCRREGITATQYYQSRDRLRGGIKRDISRGRP